MADARRNVPIPDGTHMPGSAFGEVSMTTAIIPILPSPWVPGFYYLGHVVGQWSPTSRMASAMEYVYTAWHDEITEYGGEPFDAVESAASLGEFSVAVRNRYNRKERELAEAKEHLDNTIQAHAGL